MAVILLGFMASGKSTVGKRLAAHLDLPFIDLDKEVESSIGMPISDFFAKYGQEAFRQVETETLAKLIDSQAVISTGGGVIESPDNKLLLKNNPLNIFLSADFNQLYQRIEVDKENIRPLFINNSREGLQEIFERRLPLYLELAHSEVNVDKTVDKIIDEIIEYYQALGIEEEE